MLTQRLRNLEAEAIVERRVLPTSPVQVEYHLTEKGRQLGPVLDSVIDWSHRWIPLATNETGSDAENVTPAP